ncbi:MAG: transposase, partial [Acidimicrobiia bacterium]|nr:transposase [Acidimicrobiia bacterium]
MVEEAHILNEQGAQANDASRQQLRAIERTQRKLEERRLRLLERDEEFVRSALRRREKLSGVMAADATTDGDELLWYVAEELKLLSTFEILAPPPTRINKAGKEVQCRTMYSPLLLNLLGLLSRSVGVASNPEIQSVLLTDERWMSLLGFNVAEVHNGSTRRSQSLTGKTREQGGGRFVEAGRQGPSRARLEGPRGALSFQTLADHESRLEPEAVATAFNAVIRALAQRSYFAAQVRVAMDSTGEEVVSSFQDAGVVRKEVKVQSKARRPRKLKVSVRGFKLWYVMDIETGLPLAMRQETIETAETMPARELIEQAEANLHGYSQIVGCAVDRGFLDGDLLWWLHEHKGIEWVCPSKENMHVTQEARERVDAALAALRVDDESALQTAQRAARRQLSHDGVRFDEREVKAQRETLLVAQVDSLTCTDFYGEGGSASSRVHSKTFRPTPLFATVVLRWPDRSAIDIKDAQEHDAGGKGPVVLLSPVQEPALRRYSHYDDRSLIENRLNRDAKQHFGLGQSLARTPDAMWSATLFSTLALTLYRALELHREKACEDSDRACEPLGILRYRRQLAINNH